MRKPCSSSLWRLTKLGRTPTMWCSTISCDMMHNWQPISPMLRTLQEKQDEVWEHRLTDVAGVPHEACLGLTLQVLDKLPTIPMDLSYHTPIPMVLAYGPGSNAFQTWHEDREETSSRQESQGLPPNDKEA